MARRNTGSIQQKRRGVYQITIDVSTSPSRRFSFDGWTDTLKRLRRYETFKGTREEAERRLHEMLYEADRGNPQSNWTLREWLDYWLEHHVARKRKPGTLHDYRMQVRNYVKPMLGHLRLTAIRREDIHRFQNALADKGLSSSTVAKLRQVVSGALTEAYKSDLIISNPVTKADVPEREDKEFDIPSVEDVQKLLADIPRDRYHAAITLAAFTGMRPGEVCGLRWIDVDLAEGIVHVRKTVVTNTDPISLGSPKSKTSVRDIPIDEATALELVAHRDRIAGEREKKEKRGKQWDAEDLGMVFPNIRGDLLHTQTLLEHIKKYAPAMLTKNLRHRAVTDLLDARIPPTRVQKIAGHSNFTTTARYYAKHDVDGSREAMARLAALRRGTNGGTMAAEELEELLANTELGPTG